MCVNFFALYCSCCVVEINQEFELEHLQNRVCDILTCVCCLWLLGCGNSSLAVDLYNDGYENIVNMDYSPVVISNMQKRHKAVCNIEWVVMDAMDMSAFPPSSFDVVLEKGTLDALLVAEKDPWKLSSEAEAMVDIILRQVIKLISC